MTGSEMFVRTYEDSLTALTPLGLFIDLSQNGGDGHHFSVQCEQVGDATERIVIAGIVVADSIKFSGRYFEFDVSDGSRQWEEIALSTGGPFHPDADWMNTEDARLLNWCEGDRDVLQRAKESIAKNTRFDLATTDLDPTATPPTVTFNVTAVH